ncbi:hypothetical protein PMI01_00944 [Caulobacter sp. AP07]|uniref:hypothetical protein n=1 Tax=Caulobacter sp. AP07 TaxID=1144304 RepID=UPI0002721ACD|nr:hypothetical protein [Caulobacter sp. AP07]EJL36569.1 hypothetical protein PMI01_00944 [Caulobacter sp. AP07]
MITKEQHERNMAAFRERMAVKPIGRAAAPIVTPTAGPRVVNAYNKALSGQILNPKQRGDFTAQANTLYGAQKGRFDGIAQEYRGYASDYGVDPERVVTAAKAASAPPPPMKPPVAGAKRGKDGWYVEDPNRKGSFPRIDQGPDGKWRIKSSNGQLLEWQ